MAQPRDYTRQYNFNDFQTTAPSDPLPGNQVDAELNAVKLTLDDLNENIAKIQRDDGKLGNASVHKEAFDLDALALINSDFTPRGDWASGTSYDVNDAVNFNSATYIATVAHTSSSAFATDLTAHRWLLIANAAISGTSSTVDKFEGNGSQTIFTLSYEYDSVTSFQVFVEGELLVPDDDYELASPNPATPNQTRVRLFSAPAAPTIAGNENVIFWGSSVVAQAAETQAEAHSANASGYADEAEAWASKIDGIVESTDYSSKAWATGGTGVDGGDGSAKDWAVKTSGTVGNTTEYSAKYWATQSDVGTIATNITNINSVAAAVSDIDVIVNKYDGSTTLTTGTNLNINQIDVVADNIASVNTVATNIADVVAVANDLNEVVSEVTTVADDLNETVSEIETVAANVSFIETVAGEIAPTNNISTVAGISTEIAAVAGDATDIGVVAADLSGTDTIGSVAGALTNIGVVATDIANVNTVADSISTINDFSQRYRISQNNPTADNDAGDLAYVVNDTVLKYFNGTSWQSIAPGIGAVSDDNNPALGGDLSLATNSITGTGNIDITGTVSANNLGEHTITAVASGALSDGQVVSLNSDGTVSASGPTSNSQAAVPATFIASGRSIHAAWIDDTRFIYVYQKQIAGSQTEYGLNAIVGTVSGTTITFGTSAQVTTYTSANCYLVYYEPNNQKFIVVYNHTFFGSAPYSYRLGTVSGTTITMTGSSATTPTTFRNPTSVDYDPVNDQLLFFGPGASSNFYPSVMPVDISGASPVLGTPVVVASVNSYGRCGVYDTTNDKVVYLYDDNTDSGRAKVAVGDFSGTPTFGTGVNAFGTTINSDEFFITHDPNSGKTIMAGAYPGGTQILANVGTVSGNTISLGYTSGTVIYTAPSYANLEGVFVSALDNKVSFICLDLDTTDEIYYVQAEISGNTLANVSSPNVISTATNVLARTSRSAMPMNPSTNKYVFSEELVVSGTNDEHTIYVEQLAYVGSNTEQYIGISSAAYADGDTAKIQILGSVDDAQTGLTAGTTYYLADDGTLSATNNGRKVGKATSATEILIDTAMSGPEMNEYLGGLV